MERLFAGLDDEVAAEGRAAFVSRELPPGAVLIQESDATDAAFVLEAGRVEVVAAGAVVAHLESGAVLGEIGLFTQAVRTASVRAVGTVRVLELTRAAFEDLQASGHPVAARLERRAIRQLVGRVRQLVSSLQAMAVQAATLRSSTWMEPAIGTTVPLSPQAVAALVGSTRSFWGERPRHLQRLLEGASVRVFETGEMLTDLEGPTVHLLVHGSLEAVADLPGATRRDGMVRIGDVEAGSLFGGGVAVDGQRTLRFVASAPSTVISLAPTTLHAVWTGVGRPTSLFRVALLQAVYARLQALTRRIKWAHEDIVDQLSHGGQRAQLPDLRSRSDALEGFWDPWLGDA